MQNNPRLRGMEHLTNNRRIFAKSFADREVSSTNSEAQKKPIKIGYILP